MRVGAPIDHERQPEVVGKILKHCKLWREPDHRGPPVTTTLPPDSEVRELTYDPGFFDRDSTEDIME
jgi:hypothetical protein